MRGVLKSNKLEIHLKSFRLTSLIGTIGVMVSIAGFHPVDVSSNLTWCFIQEILMVGIYKITNLINGKNYIGQSINIDKRIKEHFWKSECQKDISYNSALHSAIRKYGKENFVWEVLEECNVSEIDEKEQFYIQQYNSLVPNGYNILIGGQKYRAIPIFCSSCGKQITSDSKSGLCKNCQAKTTRVVERPSAEELVKLLKETNFTQVGKKFGVTDNAIRKWCRNYGISDKAKDYK